MIELSYSMIMMNNFLKDHFVNCTKFAIRIKVIKASSFSCTCKEEKMF